MYIPVGVCCLLPGERGGDWRLAFGLGVLSFSRSSSVDQRVLEDMLVGI